MRSFDFHFLLLPYGFLLIYNSDLFLLQMCIRDSLETEGLLITKPHCGAVVFQMSREHLTEIYEIRILMEQYCAARTCMKATDEDIKSIEAISLQRLNYSGTSKEFKMCIRDRK